MNVKEFLVFDPSKIGDDFIYLGNIRQTYILMYEENDIRYIFNRSVKWDNIISFKKLQPVIDELGVNAILYFLKKIENMDNDINKLTTTFIVNLRKFKILEIHSEWLNYKRSDQTKIEERKSVLCNKYNAVKRKGNIPNEHEIDINIASKIKEELLNWLISIDKSIVNYAKERQNSIVETALGMTMEKMKKEYDMLNNKLNQLKVILKDTETEISDNRKKLRKQNYMINILEDKINNYEAPSI